MRTSSSSARFRIHFQYVVSCATWLPGLPPGNTQGLPGSRLIPDNTAAAVGVNGTIRAPVLAWRSRRSPALRSTSSQRSVRTSMSRHPVSISRRSAAAPRAGISPLASSARSSRPTRRYSSGVRNRSRLPSLYLDTKRQGLLPNGANPQASASEKGRRRWSTAWPTSTGPS